MQFKVGEKVVYPARRRRDQKRPRAVRSPAPKEVYMFAFESDMTIMVPMENVASVGLRRIIGKDMVSKVYKILRDKKVEIDQQTWNRRYREYTEGKTGSVLDRQGSSRSLRPEGRQGTVVRRAQDARHRPQPSS